MSYRAWQLSTPSRAKSQTNHLHKLHDRLSTSVTSSLPHRHRPLSSPAMTAPSTADGIPAIPNEPTLYEADPTSYSNFFDVYTKHLHLSLTADFTAQTLTGEAFLTMHTRTPTLTTITLDTNHLDIQAVHMYADETRSRDSRQELTWKLGESHAAFGQPLHIDLPFSTARPSTFVVGITYATTSGSVGLQWLQPSQTAGKKQPYLFTQFQAIHCRTAVPVQDTPAIKFTYTADITVPNQLVALMSAPHLTSKASLGSRRHAHVSFLSAHSHPVLPASNRRRQPHVTHHRTSLLRMVRA